MRLAIALLALAAAALPAAAQQVVATQEHKVRIVRLVDGLANPWGLAFLPDGRMLVTEREGRMRMVDKAGRLEAAAVAGLPRVDTNGQGGLLDVALHPRFADNSLVYWTYVQRDDGGYGTELARGRLAGSAGAWRMENVQVLFRALPKSSGGRHFGSRIVFARDGSVFVTLGDRGDQDRAQRLDDHAGKIVRLAEDGKPAPGNPFLKTLRARPEIYSLGNRNVQGAVLHPQTGALWATEHGPQGGDELNLIRAGRNYGWPVITYGVNYVIGTKIGEGTAKPGMEQPVKYWTPSPALSGLAFYTGERFPKWRGHLLAGALRGAALIRVRLDGERFAADEFMLRGEVPRIRDVRSGPDGYVYLLTDESRGAILRLEPAD
ncbi:MAG: PQQ-dependent sugar dehydrogenase [Burkholderiales bacterium]